MSSWTKYRQAALRLTAVVLAIVPLTLLGITRTLTPETNGLGTHQQLGLPPCSMRVLAGIRCPACGMTTSWAHFTRGQWIRSANANAGGFLLACLCLLAAPVLLRAAWIGQAPARRTQDWLIFAVVAVTAVTLVQWAAQVI